MKKLINWVIYIILIVSIWEVLYLLKLFPELLFPSMRTIFVSLYEGLIHGDYFFKTMTTLSIIMKGLILGICISLVLVILSLVHKIFNEFIGNTITLMNPIPGIAIFPLIILWVGIGKNAMIVIILHSVIWSFLLNILTGIRTVPTIYKEIGINLELNKVRMFMDIYLPASMPYIIAGLKAAWAKAWRTAIAVELIAGVMIGRSGLGGLMSFQRSMLDIPGLFSIVIIIIVIGIFMEEVVFRLLENFTVKKWGMSK